MASIVMANRQTQVILMAFVSFHVTISKAKDGWTVYNALPAQGV